MIKEAFYRVITGIALGGIVSFIVLTIIKFTNTPVTVSEAWIHILLAYILGIYFGLSSLIFEENGMSMLKVTVIHYVMSIVIYFIVALIGKWVPLTPLSIVLAILIFTFIYGINWLAYYMYFKKVEKRLNENLNRNPS